MDNQQRTDRITAYYKQIVTACEHGKTATGKEYQHHRNNAVRHFIKLCECGGTLTDEQVELIERAIIQYKQTFGDVVGE